MLKLCTHSSLFNYADKGRFSMRIFIFLFLDIHAGFFILTSTVFQRHHCCCQSVMIQKVYGCCKETISFLPDFNLIQMGSQVANYEFKNGSPIKSSIESPWHGSTSECTKDASKVQCAVEKFTCPPIPIRNSLLIRVFLTTLH